MINIQWAKFERKSIVGFISEAGNYLNSGDLLNIISALHLFLLFYKTKALTAFTISLLYDCSSSQIGGLNTVHLFLKIFHVLLVDAVVLVSWELVDPLQSETIKISEEVRR